MALTLFARKMVDLLYVSATLVTKATDTTAQVRARDRSSTSLPSAPGTQFSINQLFVLAVSLVQHL